MTQRTIIIENETGIHARPATQLIALVKKFESKVELKTDKKTGNPNSMLNILALGLKKGTEVIVSAEGQDEVEACKQVSEFLENLGE